jgi:hypothetical protein
MALLGNLKGSAQVFQDTEFYNGVATQSLRFEDGSSHKLTRTFSSDVDNDKKMTISVWVKRGNLNTGSTQVILANYTGVRYLGELCFDNDTDGIRFDPGGNGDGSSNHYRVITSAQFRDVGSWYHIVLAYDSTQSTDTNRVKIYVNGEQQTVVADGSGQSFPPQNYGHEYSYNGANNTIGEFGASFNSGYLDGYLSEFNFIDGLTLDPTYFGETKNGVWIAKKYTGSYGTNGYRLEFKNTSVGTGSSSTIGADTSGNDNHWTSSGIAAHDCNMPDSPENNWCTLNPLELDENNSGAATLEGNLKWTNVNANIGSTFGFGNQGGKYYWEYLYVSSTDGNHYQGVTLQKDGISLTNAYSTGIALYFNDGTTRVDGTSGTGFGGQIGADNIIQFKLDLDNGTLQFGKNNTYISALTLPTSVGGWRAGGIQAAGSGGTRVFVANYGQDSSFAGNKTAQGNTDENGLGDFYYAVPSGFLAVCSTNLPEPTIGPNSLTQADDHFNTVTFSGTGSSPLSVTGVGFQPDWLWLKRRDNATNGHHIHYDSSRGGTNALRSSTNGAEAQFGDMVITFASDGFSFTGTDGLNASSSYSNVAWNWKANGGTTTTNDASATGVGSIDSDIQANTTAGFSIVQYETNSGTSGSSQTVGHGLSQAPNWMILKSRDQAGTGWMVYYGDNTDYVTLNGSGATIDGQSTWNDTTPTSTVFSIGTNGGDTNNTNGGSMIGYIFHAVDGYSKFANFTGNGSADGTFVFTGFRPAWVLIKNTARSADWRLHDIARQPTNDDGGHILLPNSSSAEVTSEYDIDFLSNGFKLRSGDVYENGSGELITYAAFAEAPFKYANAK